MFDKAELPAQDKEKARASPNMDNARDSMSSEESDADGEQRTYPIDLIHKWRLINYSFVFMLIILTSLTLKQKFFWILFVQTKLVRMISIKSKE